MLAMISVSAGYGIEGSRTPTMVLVSNPRRIGLPITDGSLLNVVVQKRCVSTTALALPGPSSSEVSRRPRTGRNPMTSK